MAYKVRISAPTKEEARSISDLLIEEKLVSGTLITSGESRYHWDGSIEEQEYFNIHAYTIEDNKDEIIENVEDMHSDETPIIEFIEIEGNKKFLDWVSESVKD